MKLKRLLALMLVLALTVCMMAGCNSNEKLSALVTKYNSNMEEILDDNEKVLSFYKPDLVIMTVDGEDISWSEFAPWLIFQKNELQTALTANNIAMESWDSAYASQGETYAQYLLQQTVISIQSYRAIEKNADELGVTLKEGDKIQIERDWDDEVSNYDGTEEEYKEYIANYYGSLELYQYLKNVETLYQNCFKEQYGEGGSKIPASEVLEYMKDADYLMAKHILVTEESVSEEEETDVDAANFDETIVNGGEEDAAAETKTDDDSSPAYAKAKEILDLLHSYEGDDLESYFDQMIKQYNADEGENEYYPGGYLFTSGQMVSEFETAVRDLEEGEISDIVETSYGYHIILRLPINVDATPISFDSYVKNGSSYSLRYIAAMSMFSSVTAGWRENMTVSLADIYNELNPAELFA